KLLAKRHLDNDPARFDCDNLGPKRSHQLLLSKALPNANCKIGVKYTKSLHLSVQRLYGISCDFADANPDRVQFPFRARCFIESKTNWRQRSRTLSCRDCCYCFVQLRSKPTPFHFISLIFPAASRIKHALPKNLY